MEQLIDQYTYKEIQEERKHNNNMLIVSIVLVELIIIFLVIYIYKESKSWRLYREIEINILKGQSCQPKKGDKQNLQNFMLKYLREHKNQRYYHVQDELRPNSQSTLFSVGQCQDQSFFKGGVKQTKMEVLFDQTPIIIKNNWNYQYFSLKGTILFIPGYWSNNQNWDYILQELSKSGYIVICSKDHHSLDVYKDILIQQQIWVTTFDRIAKSLSTLRCHSYGGLIASFISQNDKQFDKLILISPYFELNINVPIFCVDILNKLQTYVTTKKESKPKITTNRSTIIFNMYNAKLIAQQVLENRNICLIDMIMILSTNEHLVSNERALEFYQKSRVGSKNSLWEGFTNSVNNIKFTQRILKYHQIRINKEFSSQYMSKEVIKHEVNKAIHSINCLYCYQTKEFYSSLK